MDKREKEIERKLRVLVEQNGGLCLKWVCPGWAGVPDRIVLLPFARIIFVETKRPRGGVLSRLQLWWAERLTRLGFSWESVWDDGDLADFEDAYLGRGDYDEGI